MFFRIHSICRLTKVYLGVQGKILSPTIRGRVFFDVRRKSDYNRACVYTSNRQMFRFDEQLSRISDSRDVEHEWNVGRQIFPMDGFAVLFPVLCRLFGVPVIPSCCPCS